MDKEINNLAVKQYIKYFSVMFAMVLVVFCVFVVVAIRAQGKPGTFERENKEAPGERVYDYADIFSDKEEEALRKKIEKMEERMAVDIVIVSISQPMEGRDAKELYGYRYDDWYKNMRDVADDFYDENQFGFDKVHGDGVLFLTNDMPGHKGTWLSTCGKIVDRLSSSEVDRILTDIDDVYADDSNDNYEAHLEGLCSLESELMPDNKKLGKVLYVLSLIVPLVAAFIYWLMHIRSEEGKNTVNMNTYVNTDGINMVEASDDFSHKTVTKRVIQNNSSGGGGGSHRSSGGVRHGGGGHRR